MTNNKNVLDLSMEEIKGLGAKIKDVALDNKVIDINVGINLGNLLTKTWGPDSKHELFYTTATKVIGELSMEEIQADETLITVDGELYRIGLQSSSSGNFSQRNHDELVVVGVYAIARQLFTLNKKNLTSTGNSKYRLCCAKIGLGLSVNDYNIKANQIKLLEMFNNKNFTVEYMKAKTIINVEVMNIVQEGHCHVRFHSQEYKYSEVALFDLGSRTLDYSRFVLDSIRNKNVIAEKESLDNAGTLSIMKQIMKIIGTKKVKLLDVEPILQGETIDVDGTQYSLQDFDDVINKTISNTINSLQDIVDVEFGTVKAIVLIGGGARLMQSVFEDMYPGKKIIIPSNPQYLNAEAYYIASHKKRNFKKLYE